MAGTVKGITIEFRGDTTQLDKALRQINNETKAIDRELKNVDRALKFNPGNVDLWRQKQDLLKQKISETKEKLDLLKDEQKRMDAAGVDKNSEEYRKLQRQIIETESKVKTFESQLRKIGQVNLRAASEQVKQMGTKLTAAGNAMRGISRAAAAVTAAIGAVTVKSAKWADDLNTMSKKYSIGTGELQKYSAAAELVDVDVNAIAKSHIKLTKSMNSAQGGTGAAAEAFETLGVSVTNADGSLRDSDAVWQDTIAALGKMDNEAERDALALQLMGKSAADLNPLIEDGGKTYEEFAETMSKYGLEFIDQETLDNANEFKDQLDTIKSIGLIAFQQLGTQMAATFAPIMQKVVDLVGRLAEWISNLNPKTQAIIATVGAVLAVAAPLLLGLGKMAFAISSIMSLVATIGPVIAGVVSALGPVVLIIGGVIAAGILLYKNWDKIKAKAIELKDKAVEVFEQLKEAVKTIWDGLKNFFTNVWNGIKNVFKFALQIIYALTVGRVKLMVSIIKTVFNGLKSAVSSIWNGIKTAITHPLQTALNGVKVIISKLKNLFPISVGKIFDNIKLPHFNWSWKNVGDTKLKLPHFEGVEWYAKGGIFNSPNIIGLGEAGPEAVVPLDKFWDKMDQMNTGTNIVINVNGAGDPRAVAEEVKRVLIKETNQRRLAWQ